MQDVIYLTTMEIVRARPFTHPDHIANDRNILIYMLTQLCLLLESPHHVPRTTLFTRPENNEWFHRLVLPRPEKLRSQKLLTVVGFFGQRRENGNVEQIHEFDRILIAEIKDHPGILSYSTMALANGDYANLVLFTDQEARNHWSTSQAHAQAVNVLSPNYYLSARIYNGHLLDGMVNSDGLRLTRAKYFDYCCTPLWRGIREIK